MARFSLKSMLVGTTLIAVGLGLIGMAMNLFSPTTSSKSAGIMLMAGSWFIGYGIMVPFKRLVLGHFLGMAIFMAVFILLSSLNYF